MKRIPLALGILLLSQLAFAGDMYLVCESEDGEVFESALLVDGRAGLVLSTEEGGSRLSTMVTVEEKAEQYRYKAVKIDHSNGGYTELEAVTSSYDAPFELTDELACTIRD